MDIPLRCANGAFRSVEVGDHAFGAAYNEPLVHQVVTAYLSGSRSGSKANKKRSDVRGGGCKPWRQKGLGRARAGSIRSPIFRGGGVTFAARPRNHAQKVNRKMYTGAMRSIVSELIRRERLLVVESIVVEAPKTKALVEQLKTLGLSEVLIVVAEPNRNVTLAAQNLHWVSLCCSVNLDPAKLLEFDKVLITVAALKQLEERLA